MPVRKASLGRAGAERVNEGGNAGRNHSNEHAVQSQVPLGVFDAVDGGQAGVSNLSGPPAAPLILLFYKLSLLGTDECSLLTYYNN
jgi:hypothetical protein